MKRVLVAGFMHESNSFNPIVTTEKDFKIIYGEELFSYLRNDDSIFGIVRTFQSVGYKVIPTVYARAVPNGEVDYDFYIRLINDIIERAKNIYRFDAITLALHGSMRVKGIGDAEGYFLEELRKLFPNIPIISALDMHTTMTKRMFDNCDGFVGYKSAPHTDCFETGVQAAKMTIQILENKIKPTACWIRVPILVAGEKSSTLVQPMIDLIKALRLSESKEKVMACSYLMGYPWSDNEDSSIAVYVVTENDSNLALNEAIKLSNLIWSKRYEFSFLTEAYEEKKALDIAFTAVKEGSLPIYISDSGDNPTAGSSSDCTSFLKLIMADKRTTQLNRPILYGGIYDPIATKACFGKVGREIVLTFGAKFDTVTSTTITTEGIVKAYIKDWSLSGSVKSDVVLFNSCGVDIVISEAHIGYTDPKLFMDLGVDPRNVEIVVCKLGYLTEKHLLIAKRSILALTKGSTNEKLESINYKRVKRPIFPLDEDLEYHVFDNIFLKDE
ncbi:MAG TPA: M81 family metallopeptidase [Haloplasmataceae bacterium]